MKFNEFYNRQKNVIKSAIAKRIESNIPISEERDAFYKGELFSKYDIVESEGKQYTILEQASNYYHVVDAEGNLFRKFPKQLTKKDHATSINITESFHGYVIRNQETKDYLAEHYTAESSDDVGILKQIKQMDEQMDNSYKAKDKLTVAKIIADAVGVPYDVVSSPDNLVAAAIRKAKKDPKLVKNKDILANMLQIAREVGIKITDDTFVAESEELVEYLDKDRHGEYDLHRTASTAVISNKKYKVKHRATGKVLSIHNNSLDAVRAMKKAGHTSDTHAIVKESEDIEEGCSKFRASPKTKKNIPADLSKAKLVVTEDEVQEKHRIQVTVSDPNHTSVSMRKEQKQKFIKIPGAHSKDSALDTAKKYYKKQGYKVHSAEHVGMVKESEELDEGEIQNINVKLAQHAQRKIDHEQKYGQMNGADLHSHEVIRKQLLDKKKKLVSSKMRSESTELEETIHVGYRNSKGDWIKTSTHNNYQDAKKASEELQKSGKKGVQHRYDNKGSIEPGAMMTYTKESEQVEESAQAALIAAAAALGKANRHGASKSKNPNVPDYSHVMSSYRRGKEDAKAGKPYNNPYELKIELGAAGNYDHNSYREGYHSTNESEQLDELSIDTLKTYSAKAKEDSTKLVNQGAKAKKVETSYSKFKKATKRLDGAASADKKVFKKEWNSKVGITEEENLHREPEKTELPHGHTFNPTSEIHRKQIIKKLKGT